jgi:hypothetical protein
MLSGDSVIEGSVVLQAVSGGVDGVDYKIVCTVEIDSEPRTVLRKSSVLPVRNQ